MKNEEFYKRIKIAGMVSFIPAILVAGPLSGYFIGDYLKEKFGMASFVPLVCIAIGFAVSIKEVIRIIRLVTKIDKKP